MHAAVVPPSSAAVSWADVAAAQSDCAVTAELPTNSALTVEKVVCGGAEVLVNWSTGMPRPLVPPSLQQHVFKTIHELAHPGVRATQRLVAGRFAWHCCMADVAR